MRIAVRSRQSDLTRCRMAVPDHIGDAFAHHPGECDIDDRSQVARRVLDGAGDASGRERRARTGKLCSDARLAVSINGLTDVLQRLARDAFDVADLVERAADVARRY